MLSFLAALLAIAVLGVPLLVYLAQDRLLFHPQPLSEASRSEIAGRYPFAQQVVLESQGQKQHAWYIKGDPLVIYFGGNAEEVSWMIEETKARTPGVGWLLVSYRGYGGSEGVPSAAAIAADALRWHDHAVEAFKPRQVFVFGRSLGSGAAVQVAAARPLAGVVLVTPFDSLAAVAKRYYWYLPVDLLLRHRFDSIGLVPKITTPLLCLAAERDEVIPPEHARRLFDAWAGPKQWVALPGAGHNSTDAVPAFWRSIGEFLRNPGM